MEGFEIPTSRTNQNSKAFSLHSSHKAFDTQRLPPLHSFSSILEKPSENEIIPKPDMLGPKRSTSHSKKTQKKRQNTRKRSSVKLNGRFYTEKGLNEKHPQLKNQVKKILKIMKDHKLTCHQDLREVNFSLLKRHFLN